MDENKIVIYQTEDGQTQIDVRLENETVWLTQAQMAELFEKTPQNITMHIRNAYNEGELEKDSTCKEYLQMYEKFKVLQKFFSKHTKKAHTLTLMRLKSQISVFILPPYIGRFWKFIII